MSKTGPKIKAILEVVVVFILTFLVIWILFVSPLGKWERRILSRTFFEYTLMITIPLLLLVVRKRTFSDYGISFKNIKYHLDIILTCLIPYAVFQATLFVLHINSKQWNGALISSAFAVGLLFLLGWLLKQKPTAGTTTVITSYFLFMLLTPLTSGQTFGKAISVLIFYLFFLGPGEEIFFRGYVQSRLNAAFDRHYKFFNVSWGWGIIITSILFGLMHFLNFASLFAGKLDLKWWWGLSTFFWGLIFGFVREKTGSIIAPAILHGLSQAIAYTFTRV